MTSSVLCLHINWRQCDIMAIHNNRWNQLEYWYEGATEGVRYFSKSVYSVWKLCKFIGNLLWHLSKWLFNITVPTVLWLTCMHVWSKRTMKIIKMSVNQLEEWKNQENDRRRLNFARCFYCNICIGTNVFWLGMLFQKTQWHFPQVLIWYYCRVSVGYCSVGFGTVGVHQ